MDGSFYEGKSVLVTGHTGFKGGWLSLWLKKLGARVTGYSLQALPKPNFYSLIQESVFRSEIFADVGDFGAVKKAIQKSKPDIVFHLAAQALVRRSYAAPMETFASNTLGTVNVLEAVRSLKSPAAVLCITTDKCYENREWEFAYRENDSLGGMDPYSASKAAAEVMIHSWRESFFRKSPELGPVASARAGNVIGGGDYANDRIIPDAIRAMLAGKELIVRNPGATRPWQHVLDCLSGYLSLGKKLVNGGKESPYASAFNFGPGPGSQVPVEKVVEALFRVMPGKWTSPKQTGQPHEAGKLNLAIDKSAALLGWTPAWNFATAIEKTAEWYDQRHFKKNRDMVGFSLSQIEAIEAIHRARGSR